MKRGALEVGYMYHVARAEEREDVRWIINKSKLFARNWIKGTLKQKDVKKIGSYAVEHLAKITYSLHC